VLALAPWMPRANKRWIGPSNPAGKLNARFRQVTEKFPHQEHVGSLQLVIIAELELVGFGYDQSLVGLAENALLLQAIGAPSDGFDRQTEKAGQGGTGNTLLDLVRLDRLDTAKLPVQFGVLHDLENVGVQDRMNDHQVQRIEIVVAKHFAGCAQHVGQRVARDGSDQIRRDVLAFSRTNHHQCPPGLLFTPIWVWSRFHRVNSRLVGNIIFTETGLNCRARNWRVPTVVVGQMTFIIEAIKDDCRTVDFRDSAIVAVILARKHAVNGFAVSITAPDGQLFSADQFNRLLTSKGLGSDPVAQDAGRR